MEDEDLICDQGPIVDPEDHHHYLYSSLQKFVRITKPTNRVPLWRRVLEQFKVPQSRNSPHVMEPKIHCVVYNRPPPANILGQIISVHALSTYLLNINFNIQHLRLGLGSGFFLSGFPTKTPHVPHAPPIGFFFIYHTIFYFTPNPLIFLYF